MFGRSWKKVVPIVKTILFSIDLKVWMLTWCGGGRDKISGTNVTCRHIVLEWSLTLGKCNIRDITAEEVITTRR